MDERPDWTDELFNALQNVKCVGKNKYRADSPVTDGNTLDIRLLPDRLLLKDFGGADNRSVMQALGLNMPVLYAPHKRYTKPEKEKSKKRNREIYIACCDALDIELLVLYQFDRLPEGAPISDEDRARVRLCMDRLEMALGTRPWKPKSVCWRLASSDTPLGQIHSELIKGAETGAAGLLAERFGRIFRADTVWCMAENPFKVRP